jgi:hypothetical protein
MKRALLASLAACALSCGSIAVGDVPDLGKPSDPIGQGMRLKDVGDPSLPNHPKNNASVTVTGATVLWVDTFDETANGKSRGTVYVQDVDSQSPYAGMSLYSPTFVPGDLRVAPGDVLDLVGAYQENDHIGTAVFPVGQVLPQISKPVGTFRYEYKTPDPVVIDPTDLDDFTKGRKWLGMLVTVKNATLVDGINPETSSSTGAPTGRVSGHITPSGKGGKVTNENVQLPILPANTVLKSLTGIVTYFFDLHIAPRTTADIVQ